MDFAKLLEVTLNEQNHPLDKLKDNLLKQQNEIRNKNKLQLVETLSQSSKFLDNELLEYILKYSQFSDDGLEMTIKLPKHRKIICRLDIYDYMKSTRRYSIYVIIPRCCIDNIYPDNICEAIQLAGK